MSGGRSKLEEVLVAERDAALEEAAFERNRANAALERNKRLRTELTGLREELKDATGREADLAERLRLAMDTNWRLEKQRARLEKKIVELRGEVTGLKSIRDRLDRRIRKLEGELRIRG